MLLLLPELCHEDKEGKKLAQDQDISKNPSIQILLAAPFLDKLEKRKFAGEKDKLEYIVQLQEKSTRILRLNK
jgi:hypothetical protein